MSAADILCLNCGSSSLKLSRFAVGETGEALLHEGVVEGIGLESGRMELRDVEGRTLVGVDAVFHEHGQALHGLLDSLHEHGLDAVEAVGHRVLHGGPHRQGPARIDTSLLEELRARAPQAPLHLPQELAVIAAVTTRWPGFAQVACFDTAFHRRMPELAQRDPLPRALFDAGLRRYGYHGLSYESVLHTLGEDAEGRVIIAHLGHGSSLAAVKDGTPIDTTMGLTPSGGVMMSTRSGDLDPGVVLALLERFGGDLVRVAELLSQDSGLLGVSGSSADMRRLLELRHTDPHADQAVRMFCRSVRKAIGALATELAGLDLLVFTGGIGEHAPAVRSEICRGLAHLGVPVGAEGASRSLPGAAVRVVPTHENRVIARQTWDLLFAEPG